jgi:hypothetical protein
MTNGIFIALLVLGGLFSFLGYHVQAAGACKSLVVPRRPQ